MEEKMDDFFPPVVLLLLLSRLSGEMLDSLLGGSIVGASFISGGPDRSGGGADWPSFYSRVVDRDCLREC